MRSLLDTHAFLWWVSDSPELAATTRDLIGSIGNEIFFSAVSSWEIAIKYALGRLKLARKPARFVQEQLTKTGFRILPIQVDHTLEVAELPPIHADPFDRLLVAQCVREGLTLITRDRDLRRYPIETAW